MLIRLDRVVFDHVPAAATVDALSIRIDGATAAPEWTPGAQPSHAAYALVPTLNQQLTIQAHFSFPDALLTPAGPVQVRARVIDPDHRIIGEVKQAAVHPPGGSVTFDLAGVQIWNRGIGKYAVSWQWQYQLTAGSSWIDFERSDHIIYVTLTVPGAPWTQGASLADQGRWPWARVLDWACKWGKGVKLTSTGEAGAAKKLVKKLEAGLFALGYRDAVAIEYVGDAVYTSDSSDRVFFCTKFLDLLDGDPPAATGTGVNCSDYASALATFANALGCDVLQKRLVRQDGTAFRTNRVVIVGESPNQPETRLFGYHEFVVRKRQSDNALMVHDALLQIDMDKDPTSADEGHKFDLAEGRLLGAFVEKPGTLRYAHRLLKPANWNDGELQDMDFRCIDDCTGQVNRTDRFVMGRFQSFRDNVERLAPVDGPNIPVDFSPPVVPGFALYDRIENPLRFANLKPLVTRAVTFLYTAVGEHAHAGDRRFSISIVECESSKHARDALAWLLAQSEAIPAGKAGVERLGGVAFTLGHDFGEYLIQQNALTQIINVGKTRVPIDRISDVLDRRTRRQDEQPVTVEDKVTT